MVDASYAFSLTTFKYVCLALVIGRVLPVSSIPLNPEAVGYMVVVNPVPQWRKSLALNHKTVKKRNPNPSFNPNPIPKPKP